MRGGLLRHRLAIERRQISRSDRGQAVETWARFATVWGAVEPLQGQEDREGESLNARATHRIRIRWCDGVQPQDRIVMLTQRTTDRQRIFDIIDPPMDRGERGRELVFRGLERVPGDTDPDYESPE